jgi:hypothetical protein
LTEGSFAQSADLQDKPMPSVEDNSTREDASVQNEQDCPVEPSLLIPSQFEESKENPITSEKFEDTKPQEGIGDAFSKDHGDRFRSKVESRPLTEGRPPNETANDVKSANESENKL